MNRYGIDHLNNVIRSIGSLLFPPVCVYCGAERPNDDSVACIECSRNILPVERPFCALCGRPAPGLNSGINRFCGKCSSHRPSFDKARFCVYYSSVVRRGILQFKFNSSLYLGEALLGLLSKTFEEHFLSENLDAIIPIPVHKKRLLHRGYNQCAVLAGKLGARFGIPAPTDVLVKTRNTVPQTQLKRKQRMDNIKGSFDVKKPGKVKGKRVLVLDDVFTTGSTVSEAALTLKRHDVEVVQALVLALRHGPVEKDGGPESPAYSDIFFTDTDGRQEELNGA